MDLQAALTHNSTLAQDEPAWSSVDKTKLPRNAFADEGEPGKKSTWGYPHHWVRNGTIGPDGVYTSGDMYLHRGGLASARQRAVQFNPSAAVKAHLDAHARAIGMGEKNQKGGNSTMDEDLTKEQLKEAYPDLYAVITDEARSAGMIQGLETGRAEGIAAGGAAERSRIMGIEGLARAGHESLITALKWDGVTMPEQAALKILEAETALRETKLAAFRAEHTIVVAASDAAGADEAATAAQAAEEEDKTVPVEERAKKKWDADPKLRARYQMAPKPFEAYVAFLRATESGQVHIFTPGRHINEGGA
jgi:hypothetical protein